MLLRVTMSTPTGYDIAHCRLDSERCKASKPGSVSTELKLRSEKEKSISMLFFQQRYGPYDVREKTRFNNSKLSRNQPTYLY